MFISFSSTFAVDYFKNSLSGRTGLDLSKQSILKKHESLTKAMTSRNYFYRPVLVSIKI